MPSPWPAAVMGHAPSADPPTPPWALDVATVVLALATDATTVTYAAVRDHALHRAMADLQLCGLTDSLTALAPLRPDREPGR